MQCSIICRLPTLGVRGVVEGDTWTAEGLGTEGLTAGNSTHRATDRVTLILEKAEATLTLDSSTRQAMDRATLVVDEVGATATLDNTTRQAMDRATLVVHEVGATVMLEEVEASLLADEALDTIVEGMEMQIAEELQEEALGTSEDVARVATSGLNSRYASSQTTSKLLNAPHSAEYIHI
jgi:hypothetical protein